MTEETELCGFQPTGRSEDVPKPPKYNLNAEFWRTQWSEASGAHLMEYLRAEKLQEQQHELRILRDENRRLRNTLEMDRKDCDRYRSALVEIINLSSLSPTINDIARKAVFNTGTTGCPAGPEGVNGLTKEEIEGSGDE